MRQAAYFFFILSFSIYGKNIEYRIHQDVKSEKDKKSINTVMSELERLLPQKLIEGLPTFRIKLLKSEKNINKIPSSICDVKEGEEFNRMVFASYNPFRRTIEIHPMFLNEFLNGKENSRDLPCKHRNTYTLAVATVLHEVVHAYDYLKFKDEIEERDFYYCKAKKRNRHKKLSFKRRRNVSTKRCKELFEKSFQKTVLSTSPGYLAAANWQDGLFSINNKNIFPYRSADSYEQKSVTEHLAVNMEYFFLDENFQCRRPSLYKFLAEYFSHYPFPNSNCKKHHFLYTIDNMKVNKHNLDPERVYRIDYVLAGSGEGIVSGFGHSLFRIVSCAPKRMDFYSGKIIPATPLGPECLKDTDHHLIASFAGDVNDYSINMVKGIFGGYNSLVTLYTHSQMVDQYNNIELRDLSFFPIKFSESEKVSFLNKILNLYWEYAGNYKFLTNNCATESNDLVTSILEDPNSKPSSSFIETPKEFLKKMIDNGLIDLNQSYTMSGFTVPYLNALNKLKNKDDLTEEDLEKFFEKKTSEHKIMLEKRLNEISSNKSNLTQKQFYKMKSDITSGYIFLTKLYIKKQNFIMTNIISEHLRYNVKLDFSEVHDSLKLLSPFNFANKNHYGIPLDHEIVIDFDGLNESFKKFVQFKAQYSDVVKDNIRELKAATANLKEARALDFNFRKTALTAKQK